MTNIDQSGTFILGDRTVRRLGYGAMRLAAPDVFGPPKDHEAARIKRRKDIRPICVSLDTSRQQ